MEMDILVKRGIQEFKLKVGFDLKHVLWKWRCVPGGKERNGAIV